MVSSVCLQPGEVCSGGLLAPGARSGRLPVPAGPRRLLGAAHGGVHGRADGHQRQRRQQLGGVGPAAHQAPSGPQLGALQEAGVPHELQEARASTHEPMTHGRTPDFRTLLIPPPLPFVTVSFPRDL